MAKFYDLAILGGGPGGYVAAIRAAQLGLSACLIEMAVPGGVCLNWGCIPSKSLIHQASQFRALAEMEAVGVGVDRRGLDYGRVQARSREAADTLARGVAALLKKNNVDVVMARGTLRGRGGIALSGGQADGSTIEAKTIIVATGSRPLRVPGFAIDEKVVLSSTGALSLEVLPASMAILGAGAVGCEFAFVMNAFGVRVTLLEVAPHILPAEDHEVAAVLDASLRRSGIDVRTNTRALGPREGGAEAIVDIETAGKPASVRAEKILAAFGRTPNTDGIGLDAAGVAVDPAGRILTDGPPAGPTSRASTPSATSPRRPPSPMSPRKREKSRSSTSPAGRSGRDSIPISSPRRSIASRRWPASGCAKTKPGGRAYATPPRSSLPRRRQERGRRPDHGPRQDPGGPRHRRDPGRPHRRAGRA